MTAVNPAPGPSPIQSLSAVTLVTADMTSAVAFYDALGFALHDGGRDAPFTSYRAGSSYLNLQVAPRTQAEVWGRVIFWVDDVDALHARAVAAGLHPSTALRDAEWGGRFFHIFDPFLRGNLNLSLSSRWRRSRSLAFGSVDEGYPWRTSDRKEAEVSDSTANHHPGSTGPTTIAEVLKGVEPMGDLDRFVIDDLSPEEEDEFFRILEDA